YILEIPCVVEADFGRLQQRLDSVRNAIRRRKKKSNFIILINPDSVVVVGDESIANGLGRFDHPVQIPNWDALLSMCVPLEPLQVVLDDDRLLKAWNVPKVGDLVEIYSASRRGKKSARPYGTFFNSAKRNPNVVMVKDEETGKARKVRLCPACREPYTAIHVVHRAWGERCEECPEPRLRDRKSTRLNSSHLVISYAVFCLKKKI